MEIYIGTKFKLKKNPNQVEVIYKAESFNVYYDNEKVKVYLMLRPIQDYPLPEGGYISKDNSREENILDLIVHKDS